MNSKHARNVARLAKWTRIQLVILFLAAAIGYPLFPFVAQEEASVMPEVQHLVVPYSVAAIVMTAAIQVFLVCIWLVVGRVGRGGFYEASTARIISVAGVVAVVGCLMPCGVAFHMGHVEHIGGPMVCPAMLVSFFMAVTLGCLAALLVQIFRAAKADRDELAEVI